jgi:hypothetical protein
MLALPLFAFGGKRKFFSLRVIARRNDVAIPRLAERLCTVRDCHATLVMTSGS